MCKRVSNNLLQGLNQYQILREQVGNKTIPPIVPSHTKNVPFPSYSMWYNVIPPYLFLDSNLYSGYFNEMKMFELANPRTTTISMA
jgi:hypothetical protein